MVKQLGRAGAYVHRNEAAQAGRESLCVQALSWQCKATGAIVPPLHMASTYARDTRYEKISERGYIRDDNPAFDQVEALLCALEGAAEAMLFASGVSACTSVLQVLPAHSHIIMQKGIYFGIPKWVNEHLRETHAITCEFVAGGDIQALQKAIGRSKPQVVWIETPANPGVEVTDIAASAQLAHQAGAYLAVDSTVATPVHTCPLALGADIVAHSATKSLNGHSDVIAGLLACREPSPLWQKIRQHRHLTGCVTGSLDAYLLLRGMRTLFLRAHKQAENAMRVALALSQSDKLVVRYPGLPSHPQHAIACRQMQDGFGCLMALLMHDEKAIMPFLSHLQLVKRATSLGGIETLIEHRRTVEGDDGDAPNNLLRLSIGIENSDDIVADLTQALNKI